MTTITTVAITEIVTMLDDFVIRATLAGIAVALAAAPLGSFVVWRRMAFFGDATAHAAILGVALSLGFGISVFAGALGVALAMGLLVSALTGRGVGMDSLLGVLSHAALAFGLVAVSFLHGVRIDLMAYLFGDILAVGKSDLVIVWSGALLVSGLMLWRWSALLTATLNEDLAYAAGLNPKREQLVLTLALAITVAVAIKLVGALLIAALLIIPASAARPLARTPESMALGAGLIGGGSAIGGVQMSLLFDTPTGPSIVCLAAVIFALLHIVGRLMRRS
jgi:zinc transport system permease protein